MRSKRENIVPQRPASSCLCALRSKRSKRRGLKGLNGSTPGGRSCLEASDICTSARHQTSADRRTASRRGACRSWRYSWIPSVVVPPISPTIRRRRRSTTARRDLARSRSWRQRIGRVVRGVLRLPPIAPSIPIASASGGGLSRTNRLLRVAFFSEGRLTSLRRALRGVALIPSILIVPRSAPPISAPTAIRRRCPSPLL
mmetsp:Transcript_6999/g.17505  ORF Transcript_6999/g.17505 Transcript_6999/m.17505 type:complete len:200 (+) Transcript_6999:158-757(+)